MTALFRWLGFDHRVVFLSPALPPPTPVRTPDPPHTRLSAIDRHRLVEAVALMRECKGRTTSVRARNEARARSLLESVLSSDAMGRALR